MKQTILGVCIVCLALAKSSVAGPIPSDAKVSLDLNRISVERAIDLIATQHDLNVVLVGDLNEPVTLRLDEVSITTALDAILLPSGYNYFIVDKVIVVKSSDVEMAGDLTTEVFALSYANAGAVAKALEAMKSTRGKVVPLEQAQQSGSNRTSPLVTRISVTDYSSVIAGMRKVVGAMDVREQMVSIGVKIIETKVDNSSRLGFLWPSSVSAIAGGLTDTGTSTSSTPRNALGEMGLESGDWTWGTLSVGELSVVLDLLAKDGNSKLISDPHLTTLNNHPAEIKVQTVVPVPTINRFTESAATQDILTFQDEEVGISVEVTPRIDKDGRITVDIFPKVADIVGYVGNSATQAPIRSERSIRTRVTVSGGETIVLGGLLKEDNIERTQRVPLLGSIPVLGSALFSNSSKERATTDLLILITPKIIETP